jgi:hypothetical protein
MDNIAISIFEDCNTFDEVGHRMVSQIEKNTDQKVYGLAWTMKFLPHTHRCFGKIHLRLDNAVNSMSPGLKLSLKDTNFYAYSFGGPHSPPYDQIKELFNGVNTECQSPWQDLKYIYEKGRIRHHHNLYFKEVGFVCPTIYRSTFSINYSDFDKPIHHLTAMGVWETLKGNAVSYVHSFLYEDPKQDKLNKRIREKYATEFM